MNDFDGIEFVELWATPECERCDSIKEVLKGFSGFTVVDVTPLLDGDIDTLKDKGHSSGVLQAIVSALFTLTDDFQPPILRVQWLSGACETFNLKQATDFFNRSC